MNIVEGRLLSVAASRPQTSRPLSQRFSGSPKRTRLWIVVALGVFMAIVVQVAVSMVSLSPAEKHYLAAMHNPCAHPEVYSVRPTRLPRLSIVVAAAEPTYDIS